MSQCAIPFPRLKATGVGVASPEEIPEGLNMAEIEFSILSRQCLNRRIPTQDIIKDEIATWEEVRNQAKAKVEWKFTTDNARVKLNKLYPKLQKEGDKSTVNSQSINNEAIATVCTPQN